MVKGFDSFRKAFAGFEDSYTIIGGTACNILMDEAGLDFRATKDIEAMPVEGVDIKKMGVDMELEEVLEILRNVYL